MSGWHHPFPDTAADFSNAFYDALDVEQADIDKLLDFRDLRLPLFTARTSSPRDEAPADPSPADGRALTDGSRDAPHNPSVAGASDPLERAA